MGSTTSRLGLYKSAPDGSENMNVVTQVNNNWDLVDALLSPVTCTSGTRPVSPYSSMLIRESDTGKLYINAGPGGSASVTWTQIPTQGATMAGNMNLAASGHFQVGRTDNQAALGVTLASSTSEVIRSRVPTDSLDRFLLDTSGHAYWGSGAVTRDVELYRNSAGILRVGGGLLVDTTLAVTTDTTMTGGLAVSGASTFGDGKLMTQNLQCAATGSPTIGTVNIDVPGMFKTFTTKRASALYFAQLTFDVQTNAAANAATFVGTLSVDNVDLPTPEVLWRPAAAFSGARVTAGQSFIGTLGAAGTHTLKGRVNRVGGASGDLGINVNHSTLSVLVFE